MITDLSLSLLLSPSSVAPSPVTSLLPQLSGTSSVKLIWSYGFNGNANIIGGNITYETISNSNTSDSNKKGPMQGTNVTISDLQPFTIYNFTGSQAKGFTIEVFNVTGDFLFSQNISHLSSTSLYAIDNISTYMSAFNVCLDIKACCLK